MKTLKFIFGMMLTTSIGFAQTAAVEERFYPANIFKLDGKFAHHVILVEKATHKLHLYENQDSHPRLIKTFNMATGKLKGNKQASGDHKTPEGIYTIYDFYSKEELLRRHGKYAEIYGSGAFPMNYPNFMDARAGKGGGGIWLHSTDDDNRISKGLDSRGCVVVQNQDLKDIAEYIELEHTPIVVVQDVHFLSKTTWERNRKDIDDAVQTWVKAWQDKDFDAYINSYDQNDFYDKTRGRYQAYKAYKRAVFSRPDKPEIKMEYTSILANDEYAVVTMQQDYRSSVINDIGKKTLYLKKDNNYDWKIVGELWSKMDDASNLAFTPSKRFFKE